MDLPVGAEIVHKRYTKEGLSKYNERFIIEKQILITNSSQNLKENDW